MKAYPLHSAGLATLLLLSACGDDGGGDRDDSFLDGSFGDGGKDGSVTRPDANVPDAGGNSSMDAAGGNGNLDANVDTGSATQNDSSTPGMDATPDAAVDEAGANSEASIDPDTDAGPDAGTDAGGTVLPSVSFSASTGRTWEGTGAWRVTAQLNAAASADVTVDLVRRDASTAAAPADFTLPTASVVISAGQTTATIQIGVINDATVEGNETVVLGLTATGATTDDDESYTLTIIDDEERAWPGSNAVTNADNASDAFALDGNESDLAFQPAIAAPAAPAVLWAVRNDAPTLYQLTFNAGVWTTVTSNGWTAGKRLYWPNGAGSPDTEGLTLAEYGQPYIYAATERDNGGGSRNSILRFNTSGAAVTLNAVNEWNLTADVPASAANSGFEALTWVPDSFLVQRGFFDEYANATYDPTDYADHGTGVFFAGLEANGNIYAYVLNHSNGQFIRIAAFNSGLVATGGGSQIMGLTFDRDVGQLWANCDNNCNNRTSILRIDENPAATNRGRFGVWARMARPTGIPAAMNNEGISVSPEATCFGGNKAFLWVEDKGQGAPNALRAGTIPCGDFL